jgi:hypothetical protein
MNYVTLYFKLPRVLPIVFRKEYLKIDYSNEILLGIISKLYNIQGTSIINAITIGNNTVQQKDIS